MNKVKILQGTIPRQMHHMKAYHDRKMDNTLSCESFEPIKYWFCHLRHILYNSDWCKKEKPLGETAIKSFTASSSELTLDFLIGTKSVRDSESVKLTVRLTPPPCISSVTWVMIVALIAPFYWIIDLYSFNFFTWTNSIKKLVIL